MSRSSPRRKFRNHEIRFKISEQEYKFLSSFASQVKLNINQLIRTSALTQLNQILQEAEKMRLAEEASRKEEGHQTQEVVDVK